jgi:hypothetical protein
MMEWEGFARRGAGSCGGARGVQRDREPRRRLGQTGSSLVDELGLELHDGPDAGGRETLPGG